MSKLIKFYDQIGIKDVPQFGGKNASLGEMYRKVTKQGMRVPFGFATSADAYMEYMKKTGLMNEIKSILKGMDTKDVTDLFKRAKLVQQAIIKTEFPDNLKKEILINYQKLSKFYKTQNVHVAVRSSATAEDTVDASFAGAQETYLNISGPEDLLTAVRKCVASLFTVRAISYRADKGFDHFKIALSVGVQKMVRSDLGSSGVIFTIDTESGFKDVVLIQSIYGLGENIVKGRVSPDEFMVFKPTRAIISRSVGGKAEKMIYNKKGAVHPTINIPVSQVDQARYAINDKQVLQLADWAMQIEKHYKRPMDIEWALDGQENKLYIVQARPETVQSARDYNVIENYRVSGAGKVIISGQSVGSKAAGGEVNRIMNVKDISTFKAGEVLVTDMTDPDWEPIMKIASAIVTDKGGRTCHAAIVSRELGIPCVVGTEKASQKLKTGDKVTIDCSRGDEGFVYDGVLPIKVSKTNVKNLRRPKTKIMMNLGEPDLAFSASMIPNDGVGLARLEFIINNFIKIHPLALLNFNNLQDAVAKKQIEKLTIGYAKKSDYFIDKLSEGVAKIAAAFYPKDVIVRLSDFKSNEYANLIGGKEFEPVESNPMIGWRGANRYYTSKFLPAFELECAALKRVRDKMSLTNLKIMVPFCRTIEEGQKVFAIMAKHGLKRGVNGLEVYVMAEIPTNFILAREFAKIFDGFSIGSNDLTQLMLGIDRDSGGLGVVGAANEKNSSVKMMIKELIKVGKETGRKVGICGQAPSDFPDFAADLARWGIDSMSLIPDTVIKTTMMLNKLKKKNNK
ncbi:MAG: phosphoenolpyruvate synthase [Patescibacteria group bacterium]|nr:phosphoenolpyruvate synthase [Patescibacteria group bacterium]MDD4610637.1 phosphoenolpyruvate synthase [Patescibacteria group bacterium]